MHGKSESDIAVLMAHRPPEHMVFLAQVELENGPGGRTILGGVKMTTS